MSQSWRRLEPERIHVIAIQPPSMIELRLHLNKRLREPPGRARTEGIFLERMCLLGGSARLSTPSGGRYEAIRTRLSVAFIEATADSTGRIGLH